ncbi:MAG TPA: copper resistance protein CopC [Deltaproteobacteria bacterium]|nr:copper resistance protein CopC [Deltaproteobacteria bacterium]
MSRCWRTLSCLLLGLAIPAPVLAHAMLESSEPAAGERLRESPPAIVLHFDQALEAADCTIRVKSAEPGRSDPPATHDVEVVDGTAGAGTTLRLVLPTLPAGRYRVLWQAIVPDGHRTSGDYGFTVERTAPDQPDAD